MVYDFVRSCIARNGYPPTLREISAQFGWSSTNAPADHLRAIARKGYISRTFDRSRGLRVVDDGTPVANEDRLARLRLAVDRAADDLDGAPSALRVACVREDLRAALGRSK